MAQVQIGSTILKLSLSNSSSFPSPSLTIADLIEEATQLLLREYHPHLLSCTILTLTYRTRKLSPQRLLCDIIHGQVHHLIFVATEFYLTFYLLKPLGLKFMSLGSQVVVGKVLEIEEHDSQHSQNCIHDLLVRGMEVISLDDKNDVSAIIAAIRNPSLASYRLEVRYPGKAVLGSGMSGGSREVPVRVLHIYLSSVEGIRESTVGVSESHYCVLIAGNNDYTEQTPVTKSRNGRLSLKHSLTIPLSYSSTTLRVEVYQSNLLKSDSLVGSVAIKLRDLKPKGDTLLQLPLQAAELTSSSSLPVTTPTPRRGSHTSSAAALPPPILHLTCTLPPQQIISLLEEISPRNQDLLFHQQASVGSASLKGIYTEDFYFLNTSSRLGQGSATAHDVSLYLSNLFFHPPVMRKKLSPCMFLIHNSLLLDDRLSDAFAVGGRVDPALRVSTRVATMMTGSLKRLYSPEQVCNSLSVCLYADQLQANFTSTNPQLDAWVASSLKSGTEYSFKLSLVEDVSLNLECPPDRGYEFVFSNEELYWDWFEALTAAFAIKNRIWTDDSLTFTEDLSGVLTWRKWKVKPSLSSSLSYEVKEKLVTCSIDVKGGVMTMQIPKSHGAVRYQAIELTRDNIYALQFSHSSQDRFCDQIKLSIEGVLLSPQQLSSPGQLTAPSYELQATIGGIRLATNPSRDGHWRSNLYFSTNGCNVRHGWFPPADVALHLSQVNLETNERRVMGSASLQVATGESCSDSHKHTATSRRLSIYHKNSVERTLSGISSPPDLATIALVPDSSHTEGIRIKHLSVICPREYSPLKKGVYLVLHLVSRTKGLVKTSKMRTSTFFRDQPQWDSELLFRSEEGVSSTLSMVKEYSGICVRLMQHGKIRSTLLHEYLLGLSHLTQSSAQFTLVAEGKGPPETIPELRVTAQLMNQEVSSSSSEATIGLAYHLDSCQLDEDNCAWSATIYSHPSNSRLQSESEECHIHINDDGLSVVSAICGIHHRLKGSENSAFFLETFTSLRDLPEMRASTAPARVSIKQITAYVMECQTLSEQSTLLLPSSQYFDVSNSHPLPFLSLEDAELPEGYAWSSRWFLEPHKRSDGDGWVYGPSYWAITAGFGSPTPSSDSALRTRVWKRFFLRNSTSQYFEAPSTLQVFEYPTRDTRFGSLDGETMFTYDDVEEEGGSSSSHSRKKTSRQSFLRHCVPSVQGCVHVPFTAVMSVVVLCPTVVKCTVIVDMVREDSGGHLYRAPLKIIIGSCPAVQIASLIQDHHSLLPIRKRLDDLKQLRDPATAPDQVLEIARVIIHSLSALEDYTYECSPFVRSQIVKRKHRLVGCLVSLRRRYAHLFSDLFDLSGQETIERQGDLVASTVVASGGVEETIDTVKRYCGALSEMLRKAVISQPQGSDPDTRAYVEATISKIVNVFYSRIVETIATIVSFRGEVSKLKGQKEKLQLLFFIMKVSLSLSLSSLSLTCAQEDDVVERILRRYLPLLGFENFPPALLTMVCPSSSSLPSPLSGDWNRRHHRAVH
jgi:hypothetical protein